MIETIITLDMRAFRAFNFIFHYKMMGIDTNPSIDDFVNKYYPDAFEWWYDKESRQIKIV
jgi:hypothetical protein